MNKKYSNDKGITLIALVVTIIVLIILAGVSVNLVISENGLMAKVKNQKEQYEIEQISETLEIKRDEMAISKYDGDISVKDFTDNVKEDANIQYDITSINEVDDNTAYITIEGKYVFSVIKEAAGNLKISFESNDGTIPEKPVQKVKLADVAKPGDYVQFNELYNGATWRVLYNDATYGLQIVSVNTVQSITHGATSVDGMQYEGAQCGSWLSYLNYQVSNSSLATAHRPIGTNPSTGSVGTNNNDYLLDYNALKTLGMNNIGKDYWLAATKTAISSGLTTTSRYYVNSSGTATTQELTFVASTAGTNYLSTRGQFTKGYRVAVTLDKNLLTVAGGGSSSNPYTLIVPE